MSRVGKAAITLPSGVQVHLDGQIVRVQGPKGSLAWTLHPLVQINQESGLLRVVPKASTPQHWAMAGTTRAVVNNMVVGVTEGFQKKLTLVGVGYRAQAQGQVLNLSLGFSHPVAYPVPEGILIQTPTQTEIVVAGADRQKVGQVAAEIRGIRPPEPYKGKGVRYADEQVVRKEAKKK